LFGGSFATPPPNGTLALDGPNRQLYARIGGAWFKVGMS
jgi:hypothetical protein